MGRHEKSENQGAGADFVRRGDYTPRELYKAAPPGVVPSILWWNPAWISLAAALALSIIGLMAIYLTEDPGNVRYMPKQAVFLFISLAAFIVAALIKPIWWRVSSYGLTVIIIVLLILVLVKYVPYWLVRPRNGARRWINLYFLDFQPSELAKIVLVMALANYLRLRKNYRTLRGLLVPFTIMLVPMGLILVEPDLGTAMLFPVVLLSMLVAAGSKLWHIFTIVGLALVTVLIIATVSLLAAAQEPPAYPVLEKHQVDRIQGLVNQIKDDRRYAKTINYQAFTAMTVVGAGKVTGLGAERSRVIIHYNRLPYDHNDMIFAVVVNRWGLIGGGVLLGIYLIFCMGLVATAALTKNPFGRLICVGFCAIVVSQMIVNVGMTVGLLPITGMTLPFISYGGSSLMANYVMLGVVLGIALRPPTFFARPSFEFDTQRDAHN